MYQPAAAAAATATATAARRADPLHSIPLRTGGPLLGSRGLRGKSWGPSARTGASPAAQHCRQSRRRTGSHAGCCNSRGPAPSRRRPPRAPSARLAVGRCRGPDGGGDGERERGAAVEQQPPPTSREKQQPGRGLEPFEPGQGRVPRGDPPGVLRPRRGDLDEDLDLCTRERGFFLFLFSLELFLSFSASPPVLLPFAFSFPRPPPTHKRTRII